MKAVLLVGEYGTFLDELIDKFRKDSWKIYVLASKLLYPKPRKILEQYEFRHDNKNLIKIISSCKSEVIIFTGPYNLLYQWEDEIKTGLEYVTGLSNLLTSASIVGFQKFIYLSWENIYENDYPLPIEEAEQVSPKTPKNYAISQGEELCRWFRKTKNSNIFILRIQDLIYIPRSKDECFDGILKLCLEGIETGRILIEDNVKIGATYLTDCVEAISLVVKKEELDHELYHIPCEYIGDKSKLGMIIEQASNHEIVIENRSKGITGGKLLLSERFLKEFSTFQTRKNYTDTIPRILSYMIGHKSKYIESNKREEQSLKEKINTICKNLVPYLEGIVGVIGVYILTSYATNHTLLEGIYFFLIYVLVFALLFGRSLAIYTSLLSVIVYIIQRISSGNVASLFVDSSLYIWIAQIFFIGLSVGHLKDKYKDMEEEKQDTIDHLSKQLNDMTLINEKNIGIKDYFQDKLVTSADSIGKIYNITAKLDSKKQGEVLFEAVEVLGQIMDCDHVAIYVRKNDFARLMASSSKRATRLGKSLQIYNKATQKNPEGFSSILDKLKKDQVFMNGDISSEYPQMANGLLDENNEIQIIVFLWGMELNKMTLYYSNLFRVVCSLIYLKIVRDAEYIRALSYERYLPNTTILQTKSFLEILKIYENANKKGYVEISTFDINRGNHTIEELSIEINKLIRETDFIGIKNEKTLSILLLNTNSKEAEGVRRRFIDNGFYISG